MPQPLEELVEAILAARNALHTAGAMSTAALRALVRYASERRIQRSVETGCGATTLLLSHLSAHHTVFALDIGESLRNTRNSPLLRRESVHFVEGPTQRTLGTHQFDGKIQLA